MLNKPDLSTSLSQTKRIGVPRRVPGYKSYFFVKNEPKDTLTADLIQQGSIYYVSLYTLNRKCLFGQILEDEMHLNEVGLTIQECWYDLPILYPHVHLDMFVVMPNHLHGLLLVSKKDSQPEQEAATRATSSLQNAGIAGIIQEYCSLSSHLLEDQEGLAADSIWRPQFDSEQVLNETRLDLLRDFISDNPNNWKNDPVNPASHRSEGYFEISNRYTQN